MKTVKGFYHVFFLPCVIAMALSFTADAKAQNFGIVAEVNGELISNYALSERVDMVLSSSGLSNSPEMRSRVAPQALQGLITEALQKQEAKKLGIKVTDKDVQAAISEIEEKNKLPKGKFDDFLKSQRVRKSSVMDQLKTQILWKKITQKKIFPKVVVSDFEVEDTIKWVKDKSATRKEVFLSGILLTASSKEAEQETFALATKLVGEIRGGADFKAIAKQFSQGGLAENGGQIGWMPVEKLQPAVQKAIEIAGPNSITPPIRTEDGYRIFKIGDIRTVGKTSTYTKEKVKEMLMMQKLELEARSFMKDLRQKSFIEIRN